MLPRLPPVQESRLRVLRVVLTENKLSHLALMQQLEHLYLVTIPRDGPFPSTVFEALSKLPSLQFLSIRMTEADPIELDIVASLLDHLPPSLTHLHFPNSVPACKRTNFLVFKFLESENGMKNFQSLWEITRMVRLDLVECVRRKGLRSRKSLIH